MKESVYLKLMELLEAEEKKKPLDRDEVMSRIHAGETVEEIAAKEGVSPKFVKMLYDRATKAKSSALTRRTIREPKAEIEDQARALPIPKLARIAKDILNGMHPSDIAQAHGIEFQLASGMSKIMNSVTKPSDKSEWLKLVQWFFSNPFEPDFGSTGLVRPIVGKQPTNPQHKLTQLFGLLRYGQPRVSHMKDISPKEQDESREYVGLKLKQLLESVKTDLGNGDDKKKKKQTPSPAPAPLPASQRYDAMKALDVYGHFKIIAGREGWNERGIRMAVERVAKITGIPEEDVVALVEHLSGQKLNWKKR